jgi:hypothetical protein
MRVALTVADFLNRGALVYGSRVAVIDEPGVCGSLGAVTYAELEARTTSRWHRVSEWPS